MTTADSFFRAAFDASADPMVVLSSARIIIEANAQFYRLIRGGVADVIGKSVFEFYGDHEAAKRAWSVVEQEGCIRRELVITRCDQTPVDVEITSSVVNSDHILCVLRDIEQRKVKEHSSDRYRLLSRYAKDIVLFLARDGKILEANEAATLAYGYTKEELLTFRIHDLRDLDTRAEVDELLDTAFDVGILMERRHRRKDGTTFPVEVSSRAAIVGGSWVLLSIIRDITERHDLQAKLVQADRLSAFGLMAAGIAHEINNPLAYAMTNGELLERTLSRAAVDLAAAVPENAMSIAVKVRGNLAEREQSLKMMREGLSRVRSIVRDLRTFSHDDGRAQLVDVRAVLDSTLRLSHGELEHRARVVKSYDEVPSVLGHSARLGQVFLNLVINAAQALEDGGTIEINAGYDDSKVFVEVRDDGKGIDEALRERVFVPFFTTKPQGEGTGLGLYISRTLVTEMGGTIEALPNSPRGTVMRVTLPRARNAP